MSIINRVSSLKGTLVVWCPGCSRTHMIRTMDAGGPQDKWKFNGNFEKPTFEPSLLVITNNYVTCHSFIRDGVWDFLNDCTHELAGQKIPMVDMDDVI